MRFRYLSVRIDSVNDALYCVKISWTNSKVGRAHLWTSGTTRQKTGVFSRISQAILDRFSQPFHHMKALWVQMIDLYLVFRFVKVRCHGNVAMATELCWEKVMNADWYHLHSLH